MSMNIIIDAKDGVLGRIASYAAKQALLGKSVVVVNCNDALILGRRGDIVAQYTKFLKKGGSSQKGPKIPKVPERIMKRAIRGMLPHQQARGEEAEKRIMCYNEVPKEYETTHKIIIEKKIMAGSIKLKELVKFI